MAGRRAWYVGGALTALVAVALVAWLVLRPDTYVADPSSGPSEQAPAQVDPAAAAQALRGLVRAVDDRDASAAAAVAAPSDDAAQLLTALVGNADALGVADFSARYVDAVGPVDDQGRWQAAVDIGWRFQGYDASTAREEVTVTFVSGAGGVGIAGFGGGGRRSPVWLSGPVEVRRSAQALVVVAGSADEADTAAERADRAVPVVQQVLPRWPGRLVVEVPSSEEALDGALGAEPGTYEAIAAVSASVDGSLTPRAQVHVFLNPQVYDALDPDGAQVVMSHEATHVATDAPLTGGVPLWLVEGFADYVALRDVDLPITTTAGQIIAQVRAEGVPAALPGQAEFDADATHLGASYESAWLACRVLADLGGQQVLVRLYETVSRTGELAPALEAGFGLSEAELTTRWQQRLQALADETSDGT